MRRGPQPRMQGEDVLDAIALQQLGVAQDSIAEAFGVHPATLRRAIAAWALARSETTAARLEQRRAAAPGNA